MTRQTATPAVQNDRAKNETDRAVEARVRDGRRRRARRRCAHGARGRRRRARHGRHRGRRDGSGRAAAAGRGQRRRERRRRRRRRRPARGGVRARVGAPRARHVRCTADEEVRLRRTARARCVDGQLRPLRLRGARARRDRHGCGRRRRAPRRTRADKGDSGRGAVVRADARGRVRVAVTQSFWDATPILMRRVVSAAQVRAAGGHARGRVARRRRRRDARDGARASDTCYLFTRLSLSSGRRHVRAVGGR